MYNATNNATTSNNNAEHVNEKTGTTSQNRKANNEENISEQQQQSDWAQDAFDESSETSSMAESVEMVDTSVNENQNTKNNADNKEWTIIQSAIRYAITIQNDEIPGKSIQEKRKWIANKLDNTNGYIGHKPPHHKHLNAFKIEYNLTINRNTAIEILNNENIETTLFKSNSPTNQTSTPIDMIIKDIPLDLSINEIKAAATTIGNVRNITVNAKGGWQTANINFYEKDDELNLSNIWSIMIKKDSCRVLPRKNYEETKNQRSQICAKLTNLPFGCTAYELNQIIEETEAKTCFIPRTRNKYNRMGVAFLSFKTSTDKKAAMDNNFILRNHKMVWTSPEHKTCTFCHQSDHLIAQCKEKNNQKRQIKWNAESPNNRIMSTAPFRPIRATHSTNNYKDKRSYAQVTSNNIINKQQSLNNIKRHKNQAVKNNTQEKTEWSTLNEKLDRLENNIENLFKMTKHLATKCNINVESINLIHEQAQNHQEKPELNNHTYQYNALNSRIDTTLDQFAQLKEIIKEIANTISQNNSMETDQNNNTSTNDSTSSKWY